LFDELFDKDDLLMAAPETAGKLVALAEGYGQIRRTVAAGPAAGSTRLTQLLSLDDSQRHWLDKRVDAAIGRLVGEDVGAAHVYARFILRELIRRPGPLINDLLLAAWLGIEPADSPGWETLIAKQVTPLQYRGALASFAPRWWATGILEWWEATVGTDDSLLLLPAPERVARIADATRLRLAPARPIEDGQSDRFTTICEVLRRPLDAADGFRVDEREPEAWQRTRYISPKVVRERIDYHKHQWRVHPIERPRVEAMFARLGIESPRTVATETKA
jgi:hypothetical protein